MTTKSPTVRRILREAAELSKSPAPDYTAHPLESDLFDWHFTLRGPPNSPYADGIYHGRIVLPPLYPLRPPSFRFLTPSGRFEVNREICLSISGHHEETWQPAWGLRTALVALRSFMETDSMGQLGGLDMSSVARERLAVESRSFRCSTCAKTNIEIILACEELCRGFNPQELAVEIPSDLRMAWRDEVEPSSLLGERQPQQRMLREDTCSGSEHNVLYEAKQPSETNADPPSKSNANILESRLRGVSHRPNTQGSFVLDEAELPTTGQLEEPSNAVPARRPRDDDVPIWVDRAIAMLVIVLVALILKLLL